MKKLKLTLTIVLTYLALSYILAASISCSSYTCPTYAGTHPPRKTINY